MKFSFLIAVIVLFISGSFPVFASEPVESYEDQLVDWLNMDDEDDPNADFPFRDSQRTAETLLEVLSTPERYDEYAIGRAIGLTRRITVDEAMTDRLKSKVLGFLTHENSKFRWSSLASLQKFGRIEDQKLIVAMMSDSEKDVRVLAAYLAGEFGDESMLIALDIWVMQTTQADQARKEDERWLRPGALSHTITKSREKILRRIADAKQPTTSPTERQ